jgi:hypothetical protein
VRVFSGNGGALLGEFFAYASSFTGGVQVAAADVDGDGRAEIITGAGPGGGPHVRVFDTADGQQLPGPAGSFFAYGPNFRGGVFVAAGDVDGDGRAEIITGAGATGGPHVRVIRASDGQQLASFFAYAAQFTGGVRVGVTDLNGDRRAELVLAPGAGAGLPVRITTLHGQNQAPALSGLTGPTAGAFIAAPRPAPAQVALASPGSSSTAPSSTASAAAHDSVLGSLSSSSATDAIADDLVSAIASTVSSSTQQSQARRRAALLALL